MLQFLSADINLVATGVSKDATEEQLKDFIEANGVRVNEIELLTNYPDEVRAFTYRIAINPEDYERSLSPEVWPYRVGVRLYKNKRRQFHNSWERQSGQRGGIIHQQPQNRNRQGQDLIHRTRLPSQSIITTRNQFEIEVYN